jgi:hypothetical protein
VLDSFLFCSVCTRGWNGWSGTNYYFSPWYHVCIVRALLLCFSPVLVFAGFRGSPASFVCQRHFAFEKPGQKKKGHEGGDDTVANKADDTAADKAADKAKNTARGRLWRPLLHCDTLSCLHCPYRMSSSFPSYGGVDGRGREGVGD